MAKRNQPKNAFPPLVLRASTEDARKMARLSVQLGYQSTAEQIERRLLAIIEHPEQDVFAAFYQELVGFIHVRVNREVVSDPEVEVCSIVVDTSARGLGVGRQLIKAAGLWAIEKGCSSVLARTDVALHEAQAFYQQVGFDIVETQHVYRKTVNETPDED